MTRIIQMSLNLKIINKLTLNKHHNSILPTMLINCRHITYKCMLWDLAAQNNKICTKNWYACHFNMYTHALVPCVRLITWQIRYMQECSIIYLIKEGIFFVNNLLKKQRLRYKIGRTSYRRHSFDFARKKKTRTILQNVVHTFCSIHLLII